MTIRKSCSRVLLLFAFAAATATAGAPVVDTATYQGKVTLEGVPLQGLFDFEFTLHETPTGTGFPIDVFLVDEVVIDGGVFTTEIGFDPAHFDGTVKWLGIAVRQSGGDPGAIYYDLSPRQKVSAVPQALTALSVPPGAIGTAQIADGAVGAAKINAVQVQRRVAGTCAPGAAIRLVDSLGAVECTTTAAVAWSRSGNSGTQPGTDFLGVTDDVPFDIRVFGQRALRLQWGNGSPGPSAPNLIGGSEHNTIGGSATTSATIAGGGHQALPNHVTASGGTIGGGVGNAVSGLNATVAGGSSNSATARNGTVAGGASNAAAGEYSFAAGLQAQANHDRSFVWNDGGGVFASTAQRQFLVDADWFGIGTNGPSAKLHVSAPADTDGLRVQVGGGTKLRVHGNGSVSVGTSAAGPADGLRVQGPIQLGAPQTRWVNVVAPAFRPDSSSTTFQASLSGGIRHTNNFTQTFSAPLSLPHGAVVVSMEASLFDNSTASNITVQLRRVNFDILSSTTMAEVQTSGTPDSVVLVDSTVSDATIDNEAFGYALHMSSDNSAPDFNILYRVRITYTVTSVLP